MTVFLPATVGVISAEELTIFGAGSGQAILKAIGDAFTQDHPEVTITLPKSIGTVGAIKTVERDENLVGRVAREIKEQEQHYGLTYVPYAKNPIVFFVNKDVGIQQLSIQHILDIYSGKITNWKEVGGHDARIRVIKREEGDSSLGVLLKLLPGFKELTVTSKSKTTLSDPETIAAVEKTKETIAYGTYPNAKKADIEILRIEDKQVSDLDYPYVGILGLVFKEQNYLGVLKMFVEFAASEAAQEVIKDAGGIPF